MLFNPLKNKNIEAPHDAPPVTSEDELLNYSDNPVAPSKTPTVVPVPVTYEGNKISDLQESGLRTISLLKLASANTDKQTFNLTILKSLPFADIFKEFEAVETSENNYHVLGCDFAVNLEKNSWINLTLKKGTANSLNLAKHLIALKENINEAEHDKSLFISAGRFLNLLHKHITNQKSQNSSDNNSVKEDTSTENKEQNNYAKSGDGLTPEQRREKWALEKAQKKAITEQLNSIPLNLILEHIGANANQDNVAGKWKIHDTGHNVGLYGKNQWNNFNTDEKGTGGIALLANVIKERDGIHITNKEEETALWYKARNELLIAFSDEIEQDSIKDMKVQFKLKETFYMPHVLDSKLNEVRNYLHFKRGIPKWVINKQIQKGTLFAGAPSDWPYIPFLNEPEKLSNEYVWAVFLSVNGEGAEMRGIERKDGKAKIMASGTLKSTGGFQILPEADCNERVLVNTEAAIDAASYYSLYPGRSPSSCMGVTVSLAVDAALKALNYQGWRYELAFDNDKTGNEAAVRFKKLLIDEVGEEEYLELVNTGKVSYFPLSVLCAQETLAQNKIFYFDVNSDAVGREAATMFQKQLSKVIPMPEIKKLIKEGKIKYANICPNWETVHDPVYEAKEVIKLLSDDKPFYFRMKGIDEDKAEHESERSKEHHEKLVERKILFERTLKELAKDKYVEWEATGKIIHQKMTLVKDWNEYFLFVKNKPEIKAVLEQQEKQYGPLYSSEPKKVEFKLKKKP